MSEIPRHYSDMAPGMEQVVYAGDALVLRDNDGNEFSVIAREGEQTMEFIKAFDQWFTASNKLTLRQDIVEMLWLQVKAAFNALPMTIQRELPSFKEGGILLPHQHG